MSTNNIPSVSVLANLLIEKPEFKAELDAAVSGLLEGKLAELDNQRASVLALLGRTEVPQLPAKKSRKPRTPSTTAPAAPVDPEIQAQVLAAIKAAGRAGIKVKALQGKLKIGKTKAFTDALEAAQVITKAGVAGGTTYHLVSPPKSATKAA